jgi:hypothetical protein
VSRTAVAAALRTTFVISLLAAAAGAQTTGQIEGTVADDAGAALAGATVEATSAALQGAKLAITDQSGGFRFVFLPPGSYAVRCSLAGFSPVEQDGIVVPLGRTVTLQVRMQPAFREEVSVTAAPPTIDVRSPEVGANVDRQFFLNLPLDRDFVAVLQAVPGTTTDASGTVVYGSSGRENVYYIDGINTNDTWLNSPGRLLNFEFIDEVQVRTGGYAAEFGRATGGVVNVITRSGGNAYHGDVFGYYFSDALQSKPLGEIETFRREYGGSYTVDAFRKADLGFDLGGYLLKDKLWFFAAYDRIANNEDRRVAKDFTGYGGPPEGKIYVLDEVQHLWSGKLTWRPAAGHSLIASAFGDPSRPDGPLADLNGEESTFLGSYEVGGDTAILRYEGVLGGDLAIDAQLSRFRWRGVSNSPNATEPQVIDQTTPQYAATGVPFVSGGVAALWRNHDTRDAARADATLFVGNLAGEHELKAGAEVERVETASDARISGGQWITVKCATGHLTPEGCPDEWLYYAHRFAMTGIPPGGVFDPDFLTYVADGLASSARSTNLAAYLQDTWRVLPALTLNLGLRWERQRFYDTHDVLQLSLDDEWAPRLGLAWDVRADGSAKVFGSLGRFYENAPLNLTSTFQNQVWGSTVSRGPFDLGCDSGIFDDPEYQEWCGFNTLSPTPVDPAGVKGGFVDEAVLGGELSVARDLVLGAKLIYRDLGRVVEDSITLDGGYMGNPGHGHLAEAIDITWVRALPVPPPKRRFRGVELTATKRFSSNWQMIVSYLWSKLEGNYDGAFTPDWLGTPNWSPAWDFVELTVHNDGYLSNDHRHQAKVAATYIFPFGLTAGASAHYSSGAPVSALGVFAWYGNAVYLSQRGAWARTDPVYEVDLHLGYPITLGGAQVSLLLDVFHLLDRQGEIGRDQRYNLDWNIDVLDYATGEPLPAIAPGTPCTSVVPPESAFTCNAGFNTANAWQEPRSVRLGVRVTF